MGQRLSRLQKCNMFMDRCRITALRGRHRECPVLIRSVLPGSANINVHPHHGYLAANSQRWAKQSTELHGTADIFRWANVYLAFERKTEQPSGTSDAIRCLDARYNAWEDEKTTLNLFQAALAGGTKTNIHRLKAECMIGIGDIMFRRGDLMQARQM